MDQLYLSHLGVTTRPGGDHVLTLRWFDRHGHLQDVSSRTDLNLGHIMAAFSACLKRVYAIESGQSDVVTTSYGGPIELTSWTITELSIIPYRWHMRMTTDRFSYDCNMEASLELVILAFSGALKFFAFKHGLTTLEDDHVRSRDRAGELGLLTREDFH